MGLSQENFNNNLKLKTAIQMQLIYCHNLWKHKILFASCYFFLQFFQFSQKKCHLQSFLVSAVNNFIISDQTSLVIYKKNSRITRKADNQYRHNKDTTENLPTSIKNPHCDATGTA